MPEPSGRTVRPTAMKLMAPLVAVLVVLAGCGSERAGSEDSTQQKPTAAPSSRVAGCAAHAPQVTGAKTVATADLNGDGTPEQVKLTAPGGKCGDTLFARLGEGYVATGVPADPPVSSAFAVDPGHGGQWVVTRGDHPRGGYQLRVYAAGADKLVELQLGGQPLPFVATDVQEHPWSIDCSSNGLVFTEAVPHEPVGVVPAWDVKQTTNVVHGTTVTAGPTKKIADNVLPKQLGTRFPDLVRHAAFTSCRVPG